MNNAIKLLAILLMLLLSIAISAQNNSKENLIKESLEKM